MAKVEISLKEVVGGSYKAFWRCKKPYRIVKGSRGSKKSKTAALNFIVRLMQYPAANLLVVRKTYATLRDSCYAELKWAINRLGVSHLWKTTQSPLEITYIPTGQKILFRGMDDPLKITSITVDTGCLCFVWIEEAYEITDEDAFNKLEMSIRGEVPEGLFKQFTMTFNPWSAQSWLKKRFFDVEDDDVFTLTTTYKCNEWLDASDIRKFEKMRVNSPRRYRIEGLGDWGIAEGLIYENVSFETFDIDAIRRKEGVTGCYGLDFGYTDPNAFVAAILDHAESTIYVFDEWYKTGVTNARIAERIGAMGYASQTIYCDSAEPKSIAELQDYGIRAEGSRKGKDSVLHGIKQLQGYKIVVHTRCTEFYHEISNYCWELKDGKPTDKPEHEFSHGMDALRYATAKALVGDRFSWD